MYWPRRPTTTLFKREQRKLPRSWGSRIQTRFGMPTRPRVTASRQAWTSSRHDPRVESTTGSTARSVGTHLPSASSERRTAPTCLLYTSDAADDLLCVDLGG